MKRQKVYENAERGAVVTRISIGAPDARWWERGYVFEVETSHKGPRGSWGIGVRYHFNWISARRAARQFLAGKVDPRGTDPLVRI